MEQKIYDHKDRLYRLCMYLEKHPDKADELFQDTWVRAIENKESYEEDKPFYPWLTQIAVNIYRDRLRRFRRELKRRLWIEDENLEAYSPIEESIEQKIMEQEKLRSVRQKLEQLPDKYRVPLVLMLVEKLSYKEIAVVLEIEEKLVKSRIYDGRQKLKKQLEEEGLYD